MLATHQMQTSYVALPSRSLPWSTGRKLESYISLSQVLPRAKGVTAPKHPFPIRFTIHYAQKFKAKRLCICSFKANPQNEESSPNGSSKSKQHPKSSSKISYVPQSGNLPELQDVSVSGTTKSDDETMPRSQAIQKLFRHWLTLLWTEFDEQVGVSQTEVGPSHELSQSQKITLVEARGRVLKKFWRYFLGLDATIKIPVMIFVPLYLVVSLVYRVAGEMTPLWILGPLVVAIYVEIAKKVIALYVITGRHTVQVCKNLPVYMVKLGEAAYHRVWIPLLTTDYIRLPGRKWKAFRHWQKERAIDIVECIWPLYYRWLLFAKNF